MEVLVYFVELLRVLFGASDSIMKGALLLILLLGFLVGIITGLVVSRWIYKHRV